MATVFDVRTDRLELRRLLPSDAPKLFERYTSDPEVTRWLPMKRHTDVEETYRFIRTANENSNGGNAHILAVIPVEDPWTVVGLLSLVVHGDGPNVSVSVGFGMARDRRAKAGAKKLLLALKEYLFTLPDVWRVWCTTDVDNVGVVRLLENVGLKREGVLRRYLIHPNCGSTEPRDCVLLAVTRDDMTMSIAL